MNLPAFCIHRPVFTIVLSLVLTIAGVLCFILLPLRWIPNVNTPQVSISTRYPGANARLIEKEVTKVIEETLSGVNGIETINSTSRQGESQISLMFKLGYNIDNAVQDIKSSLERVRGALPKDAENPQVLKASSNNEAIMIISFYRKDSLSSEDNNQALSNYVEKYIVPTLETLDGVGKVDMYGKRTTAMFIRLDPAKLAGLRVTIDDVMQLLQYQQTAIPGGQIKGRDRYYSVLTDMSLKTPREFNELILRTEDNQVIRLKDVGEAQIDVADSDSSFRVNGKTGIALGISAQSIANPLVVESQIQRSLKDLKRNLPHSIGMNIIYNQADYIRSSIHSVYESLLEAVFFVWIVIFAFLCAFRATWIPIITIPVCLISTFMILAIFGFSINTITLMAFVLAIGLVVDDAIVMLENINYWIEKGLTPLEAALKGSKEMIFPVIVMTLTLAAVYAPIAFTPGLLGVLFKEFTFTLAGAVCISGIVALTLSPMMCAFLLKPMTQHPNPVTLSMRYEAFFKQFMSHLQLRYQSILKFALDQRRWVLIFLIIIGVLGGSIYYFIPAELAPAEDMNAIQVYVSAPRGASFQYLEKHVKELETIYPDISDIHSYLSASGTSSATYGFQWLMLKPKKERILSTEDIIATINAKAKEIPGVRVNAFTPAPPLAEFAGGDEGDRLGMVLMTTQDYEVLERSTQNLITAVKEKPIFAHVDHGLKWDNLQFELTIDRDRAADLKVSLPTIIQTIATLQGKQLGKVNDDNVIVQLNQAALSNPNIFQDLFLRNTANQMIPLSQILTVKQAPAPSVFKHYDRLRADTLYLTLAPNIKVDQAVSELRQLAKTHLPEQIKFSFTGEARSFLDSTGKTFFTFLLALIFIYLVLAAQFESFIDPLIILLTVPFALIGALLFLKLFGGSLNIYSNIGMVSLIGLIAKHGILITEFANRLKQAGYTIREAVIEASLRRLRPILMTTAAMLLGALPLAFAMGPGSESRQQIGLVIVGGLFFGTLFSLLVVPVFYTYLSPFSKTKKDLLPEDAYNAAIL